MQASFLLDADETIDDVGHYTPNEREQVIASYEPYMVEARTKGIPMLGSGRVFPLSRASITVEAFEIPDYWPVLGAIDFGWDHPTGCVAIAWDRDADCIYVTHAYKQPQATPDDIVPAIRPWNTGMNWAWPHDGNVVGDRASQQTYAQQYTEAGIRMLPTHATFPDGGHGTEAGIMEMLKRMKSGRLKVFAHLEEWFAEFDVYHRKDGKLVKEQDDLISATRVAIMAKRFAKTRENENRFPATAGHWDPFNLPGEVA